MTLNELNGYTKVLKAIEIYEKELAELYKDSAGSLSPDMSGLPRSGSSSGSKVELGYERNEKRIRELKEFLTRLRRRLDVLDAYFADIRDAQTALIFDLRFRKCLSWQQIADDIGGNNTEDTVKKICYRYIEKSNQK